jgi:hypothetical protein
MKKLMLIPAIALISGCMQTTPQKTHSFDNEFKIWFFTMRSKWLSIPTR